MKATRLTIPDVILFEPKVIVQRFLYKLQLPINSQFLVSFM